VPDMFNSTMSNIRGGGSMLSGTGYINGSPNKNHLFKKSVNLSPVKSVVSNFDSEENV